ncbi:murein DD-endopeptidase MepM [Gallibacterium anatis]|uniref:Murein DD-endopeptidase MepM n=1 Tax=Gallibacterium anatis TaxID=750 RepID=A0A921H891_9PAST|nr:murein DD-endopeptidase MepM [Gallibacterium anatis]MBP4134503.1 murein DD-endopeptidase MepM [Gallibacterium anatis]HJF73407.1 murein DD-endopeptidase MepM [Gallibacterium anatis]
MQHIKLARDRLKRKIIIRTVLAGIAILCFTSILYFLLHQTKPMSGADNQAPVEMVETKTSSTDDQNKAQSEAQKSERDQTESDQAVASNDTNATDSDENFDDQLSDDTIFSDDELPQDAKDALSELLNAAGQALSITNQFGATVADGDTLADILGSSGLEVDTVNELYQLDPTLKKLQTGQQLYWILSKDGDLQYLNWLVSRKEERVYERQTDGRFTMQIIQKQSIWKEEVLKGDIEGNLYSHLRANGLDSKQIYQLINALQWQISLTKLQKGDRYAILVNREYLNNKLTGQGNVMGIHIISRGKSYYAIQAENGRYYNNHGETLGKGFSRYPTQRQYRISSHFNPRRKNPVTGRIAPHKGVDFSMPIGTPIIAPADGVVVKVSYQAGGAGRYVMLRHGREYQTVYMHLSRPLVKPGQSVKKGQRIALSGNTGRSTGPHLHYEFHINGVAVNPMKVKLPGMNNTMASKERQRFLRQARVVQDKLKM